MSQSIIKKSVNLPRVGEIVSSNVLVPVNYSYSDGDNRWTTYMVFNGEWELNWKPMGGLACFFHRKNFSELESFPWVNKVKVVKHFNKAVLLEIFE